MINLPVPYFCQRENKYIWYQKATKPIVCDNNPNIIKYNPGDSILETKKPLAPITCNITSLCMILHYFGITDDSPDDMLYKIFDSEEYKKRWEILAMENKWLPSRRRNFTIRNDGRLDKRRGKRTEDNGRKYRL